MRAAVSVFIVTTMLTAITGCSQTNDKHDKSLEEHKKGTFGYDAAFLSKHEKTVTLQSPDDAEAKLLVIPAYQGRVMTSTAGGALGNSYGWVNYALIEEGVHKPHINAFGGEDRFWLSPEGGQFSVYFKKGDAFTFDNWQTPAVIDSERFEMVASDASSVSLSKKARLANHSGTEFDFEIQRRVVMLDRKAIAQSLGLGDLNKVKTVAYYSDNVIVNTGKDWQRDTGAVGVWILGMFTPGPATTIIAPFTTAKQAEPGLTSNYFGDVPADRLKIAHNTVFLKADGKFRSKIGLAPASVKPVAGSYDAVKKVLTIIQFDTEPMGAYMKSTWELHKDPYSGDALNAYNDGPLADGSQMGPFYELESSSPAKFLKTGEKLRHRHTTFHFEGDEQALSSISSRVLGVEIDQIVEIFK